MPERPHHRAPAPPGHGGARHRVDRARFPLRQHRPLSGVRAGHQLCGALGEAQRAHAQDAARSDRPLRPVERRAPRHARRHAAARSALCRDPAAGRLARARCERALRRDVVAGDQSVQPLPARQARLGRRQSAGMAEVHHRAPRRLLAERGQHGGGQPDARARARREGCSPRRRSGSRAAATRCTTTRTRSRAFPGNEPQRFVANYRKAGGEITLEYIDAERHAGHSPDLSKTGDMFERMVAFVGRHIKVDR